MHEVRPRARLYWEGLLNPFALVRDKQAPLQAVPLGYAERFVFFCSAYQLIVATGECFIMFLVFF